MTRRAAVIAVVALLLGACGSSSTDTGAGSVATDRVQAVKSYRFAPENIAVKAGTTVTWTNDDNFVHNVHVLGANSVTKALPVGGSASITFDRPSLVRYRCSLHPAQMSGTVQVT